ncbi:fungal hydrophobin [Trametopsis cervina]|nr:fungal hydrophobin [Trametopsis cervina]
MHASTTLVALALATLGSVYAMPNLQARGQCDAAPVQCCNTVQSAGSPDAKNALDILSIVVKDLGIPIGLGCTPLNVLGVGSGGNCASTPVCCSENHESGISISCLPIVAQL